MITKEELRRSIRAQLQRFTPAEIIQKSTRICEAIAAHPWWRDAGVVCLFAPQPLEPNVDLLWEKISGKRVCYPRVKEQNLDLLFVPSPEALAPSRWNLREPLHAPENLAPLDRIDLLLVPGLAFSRGKGRLGRGGGFYDRLIAQSCLRARKIGVCFDLQLAPELPVEAHDREVDQIVTESGAL
jgi:5-formyltetrahydrofolate cyclo-ligase